jgi:uncharacterized membrane protein YkvA (DUF1232 family)
MKKQENTPADTPFFKQVLALAAELALSRFRVLRLLVKAYRKLTDPKEGPKIREEVADRLLLLIRMAKAIVTLEYRKLPWVSFVRLVAGLLYFVTIADLVPDFIPFLGFTDDALIIAWVYNALAADLQAFEEWETTYAVEWQED